MTHRRILAVASRLAERGPTIARQCRGISVAALRGYAKARQDQCRVWSEVLGYPSPSEQSSGSDLTARSWHEVRLTLEEIATAGILLRVASTLLHAIGDQLDIPLAIDVAGQTARAYQGVVQKAMAYVAVRNSIAASQLEALDRLGRLADRLSDLLCGALLPALKCDRFLVDHERARDFASTFARQPGLLHIPIAEAVQNLPQAVPHGRLANEVERALSECLSGPPGKGSDVKRTELRFELKPFHGEDSSAEKGANESIIPEVIPPVAFPRHSFVRSFRRLKDSTRE